MPAAYDAQQLQGVFGRINERMRAIEDQLAVLSEKAGVPYQRAVEEVPAEVTELARAGKTMDAIQLYREMTGADFEQVQDAVTAV